MTLKGHQAKTLPELNDEFADSVVKGKTMAELREMAREELGRQKASGAEADKRNQIMKQLLSQVECELPQGLVRQETQRLLSDIVRENQARGVTEEVLKENEKELVGAAAQNARERLKGYVHPDAHRREGRHQGHPRRTLRSDRDARPALRDDL